LIEERQDDPARFTSSKRAGSHFGLMPIENKWNYGVQSGKPRYGSFMTSSVDGN